MSVAAARGQQPAPGAYDAALLRRFWQVVRPHQRLVWLGLALLLVLSGCKLALPYLVKVAIDDHLVPDQQAGLYLITVLYLAVAVAQFFLQRRYMYTVDSAGQNALYDLRVRLFRHLQRLPSAKLDRTPTGRLVGRVTTDIEALQELFSSGVVTIIGDLFFLGATVAILFALNWRLTLVTLLAVPVLLVVTVFIRVRVRAAYVQLRAQLARLNAFLHEQLSGMPVVQMFVRENDTRERFQEITREVRESQLKSVWWESNFSAVTEMLGSFTMALILWYGGGLVAGSEAEPGLAGGLTLGTLFAFTDYMQKFFVPLTELSQKYTVMQNAMTAGQRVFELLDLEVESDTEGGAPPAAAGAIEFRDVVFGYDPDEPVLKRVSFKVAPGERVAIVGATGSGKTTIIKLLVRLYDVQQGAILLDGADLRELSRRVVRSRVRMVTQDPFLFEGDVVGNIRLGHPEIAPEQAIAAADRLHLDQVVARFPGGYHEQVRERGRNLSAGEKQLISFARVLAVSPSVLALDEATSNVDSHSEHLLQEAVHEIMAGRTSLIIAHRLSTIRDVDRILVMHRGELVEEGSHQALLERRGVYWRLYQLQYRDQESAGPAS